MRQVNRCDGLRMTAAEVHGPIKGVVFVDIATKRVCSLLSSKVEIYKRIAGRYCARTGIVPNHLSKPQPFLA